MDGQSTVAGSVAGAGNELPPSVDKLANGAEVTATEERDALSFFLTATGPADHWVDVEMDFEGGGMRMLRFWIRPQRGKKIEAIENRHKKGDGPFAAIDQLEADAELAAEAILKVEDPESGRSMEITDERFMQGVASPVIALQDRFKRQEGLLGHIANRVRGVSGWNPERVSEAKRIAMGNAVGKP